MIEAVGAVMPHAAVSQSTLAEKAVDTPAVQKPDETAVADFAKQVASSSQSARPDTTAAVHPRSVEAVPPSGESDVAKRISAQANSLAEHLRSMSPGAGAGAPKSASDSRQAPSMHDDPAPAGGDTPAQKDRNRPHITDADRAAIDANIAQMEHAYVFAIEATLASRGSTEATKIFNTLLRGQ